MKRLKSLTKKQLTDRCAKLEKENKRLRRRVIVLDIVVLESMQMLRETLNLIPMPNYDYARGT